MQTTVTLPDQLAEEASLLAGKAGLSQLIAMALQQYVLRLQNHQLSALMLEGYRAEAEDPSLEEDWSAVELDHLTCNVARSFSSCSTQLLAPKPARPDRH